MSKPDRGGRGYDGRRDGQGDRHDDQGGREFSFGRGRGGNDRGNKDSYRGGGGRRGRGGCGRPQGGRLQSPVRKDVRLFAEKVTIKRAIKNKVCGQEGLPVEVVSNYYPIRFKSIIINHYDIDITLKMNKDNEFRPFKGPSTDKIQVWKHMMTTYPDMFIAPNKKKIPVAYDGQKNIFTAAALKIDGPETREVTTVLDGYPEQTFQVAIKYVKEVDLARINNFFESKAAPLQVVHYRDVLQVLDIISHYIPLVTRVLVGRNLFPMQSADRIETEKDNTVIAFGHHQSVVMTEAGLMLNIDRSTTAFRSRGVEEPLIDFISRELKTTNIGSFRFNSRSIKELGRKLKDLKIFTKHIKVNNIPQKRKHTIDSMSSETPDQEKIQKDDKTMSIEQYFREIYGVKLSYRNVPLVQIKGGSAGNRKYLPAEICFVYPNQPMPRVLISPVIQNMLVESSNTMKPAKRFDKIQEARDSTVEEDKENLLKKFGIEIGQKPIKLMGRQLPSPVVNGDSRKLEVPCDGGLKRYLVFNLSKRAKPNVKEHFENFFNHQGFGLIKTAGRMGLNISSQPMDNRLDIFTDRDLESISSAMAAFESAASAAKKSFEKTPIQMIFIVIPDVPQLYEHIKLLSDIQIGIATQCIKEDNFIRSKPGYFNNLTLKINAKLNGRNQALTPSSIKQLPAFLAIPTMIIGADVCHPGYHNPLANERVISSIAAVVGSYDKMFTKYVANASAQPARTEIIADFDIMVVNLIKFFSRQYPKYGDKFPKHIVVFRDGVSESQLDAVRTEEVQLIEKAYRTVNATFKPKITVFVVQKRHHTRIMPVQSDGNVRAGTVVDHTITSPFHEEFHLCSHNGPLGTSRHAKYAIIRDDHDLTPDQRQKLAFYMCHAYCRSPNPISIPIPVKYADLAAYRTKQHANQINIHYESRAKSESEPDQREREKRNIALLNRRIRVHENLEFLPYYC